MLWFLLQNFWYIALLRAFDHYANYALGIGGYLAVASFSTSLRFSVIKKHRTVSRTSNLLPKVYSEYAVCMLTYPKNCFPKSRNFSCTKCETLELRKHWRECGIVLAQTIDSFHTFFICFWSMFPGRRNTRAFRSI